jgi:hypothetical protein
MLMSRVSIDIRALPSLVPPAHLNITARAVVPVIEDNIAKLKTLLASNDLSSELNPTPPDSTCQFAVYAQVHPSNVSAAAMRELEDELMRPTGITTVSRPPLRLDVAVISPECGILIAGKDADGMRSRIFFRKVTSCMPSLWLCSSSADLPQMLASLGSSTLPCFCCFRTRCQRAEPRLLSRGFPVGRSSHRPWLTR